MKASKWKIIEAIKRNVVVFNRWRKLSGSGADLRHVDLRHVDLSGADLRGADLRDADLRGADLDFSSLYLSCKTLSTKFDQKQLIQFLYHVAAPTQRNSLDVKDKDLKSLLKSKTFIKVVNKFHRVEECGKYNGGKK